MDTLTPSLLSNDSLFDACLTTAKDPIRQHGCKSDLEAKRQDNKGTSNEQIPKPVTFAYLFFAP
jgi:hypothetical protein